mgnify:CR=1 FL=1|tara:strand:- start:136 stop:852 length:717 start_codon:yes stop_codon:yes gene_type:complete
MNYKKIGLIGIGKWGKILKNKLKKHSKIIFVANSKTNYDSELKKIDWIFIATPDGTHASIVNKCIKKKVNIFCEKPLTKKYSTSLKLFNKANKNNVLLYVDDIQSYLNKKIILKKINYITRQKNSTGNSKNLLFRFAYHDLYFLYDKLKNYKVKKIQIINTKRNLKFKIQFGNKEIFFYYDINSHKKIHQINSTNFITRKDVLSKMIKSVLNEKVDFKKNMKKSLFANKIIDMVIKKL